MSTEMALAWDNLGMEQLKSGRPQEAMLSFGKACQNAPTQPAFHSHLGVAASSARQWPRAVECFTTCIHLEPDNPSHYFNLANSLRDAGHLHAAIIQYQQALLQDGGFAAAHNNLGLTHRALGNFEDAEQAFRMASATDPQHERSYLNLCDMLVLQGRIGEAQHCLEQALQHNPQFLTAFNNLLYLENFQTAPTP